MELGERRAGLSLFPWPLGAERLSGSSREPELPGEDASLWNDYAPKGLCCFQCEEKSLFFFWREGKLDSISGIVGCISVFLLSWGATMFSWAFLAPTSTMAGTHSLFPAKPVGFLPSHVQEKRNQRTGWYEKIKSDFLTV